MPPLRQSAILMLSLLVKLAILWLIVPGLITANILLLSSTPSMLGFEWTPFLYASGALMVCCAAVAWLRRDWGAIGIGMLTVATVGVMFMHLPPRLGEGIEWGLSLLSLPAVISFLYRNRITEPLLIFPALFTLACLFILLLYPPVFLLWVQAITPYKLTLETLQEVFGGSLLLALLLPTALLYWLGKHGHAPWLAKLLAVWRRCMASNSHPHQGG